MGKAAQAKKLIKNASVIDNRHESDTVKLWESYREQALLWRALSLLQIPATLVAVLLAYYMANTRNITLKVPQKPLPGLYAVQEIPDSEFVDVATEFVNLIATYQPTVARRQFTAAMDLLKEPMLSKFHDEMMQIELKAIENTNRTQIFFVDPLRTTIRRGRKRQVTVSLAGERMKIISGKELPLVKTRFTITMTTIPKNRFNPYGIVVTNIVAENLKK